MGPTKLLAPVNGGTLALADSVGGTYEPVPVAVVAPPVSVGAPVALGVYKLASDVAAAEVGRATVAL